MHVDEILREMLKEDYYGGADDNVIIIGVINTFTIVCQLHSKVKSLIRTHQVI